MPHSTIYQCAGCELSIAGDEEVTEFVEWRSQVPSSVQLENPTVHYSHVGHEFANDALRHDRTGRSGVLDNLRDTYGIRPQDVGGGK